MIYLGWPDDHYNFNQPNGFRHPHLIRGGGWGGVFLLI